jgi:hypothetical protein
MSCEDDRLCLKYTVVSITVFRIDSELSFKQATSPERACAAACQLSQTVTKKVSRPMPRKNRQLSFSSVGHRHPTKTTCGI